MYTMKNHFKLLLGTSFFMVILFLCMVSPAKAAVTFVQGTSTVLANCGSAHSITLNFASSNTAGNLIVVTFSDGLVDGGPEVVDTSGNTYYHAVGQWDQNNSRGLEVFYAPNILAGANTITIGFDDANASCDASVSEYSGVATTTPIIDASSMNFSGTGTTTANGVTSNAGTTRTNGALIFSVVLNDSASTTVTAGTGFTKRLSVASDQMATEDEVQGSAGSIAATFTDSTSSAYLAEMVAFRAAGAAFSTSSGITFVQSTARYDVGCVLSSALSVPFPGANQSGDLIIAALSANSNFTDIAVSDTRGNTYAQASENSDGTNDRNLIVYYAANIKNGTNTITFGFPTAGNSDCRAVISEYSGVATTSPIIEADSMHANASGTSTTNGVTSNALTTIANGDLLVGVLDNTGGAVPVSPGSGFTMRDTSYSGEEMLEDEVQGSAGSAAATFTDATSTGYLAHVVAFRAAGATYAPTGPAIMQYNGFMDQSCTSHKISSTFPAQNTAGDLMIVAVSQGSSQVAPTISDTRGNTFYQGTPYTWDTSTDQSMTLFYATNIANGTDTVTAAVSNSSAYCMIAIQEYTGVATSTPVYASAADDFPTSNYTSTSTNAVSSGYVSYYRSGDLMFAVTETNVAGTNPGTTIDGTGFTERMRLYDDTLVTEDKLTTAGLNAGTFTLGNLNGAWTTITHMIIFGSSGATAYASGTLDSTTFDTGVSTGAQYNSIAWSGTTPASTSVEFQFAASNSSGGPWNFTGPDGTANTYYTAASGVPVAFPFGAYNNLRYYRYQMILVPSLIAAPTVNNVTVNWSP